MEPEDDDPWDIHIPESVGSRALKEPNLSFEKFLNPLKIKKVNIGSPENPKIANIGDYGDDESVGKINDLLHKFQEMFSTKFTEMKGIVGDLGEMKILLKAYESPSN